MSNFDIIEKHEKTANMKAVSVFLPYEKLENLGKQGYTTVDKIAEYLNCTKDFVEMAVEYHKQNGYVFPIQSDD